MKRIRLLKELLLFTLKIEKGQTVHTQRRCTEIQPWAVRDRKRRQQKNVNSFKLIKKITQNLTR